MPSKTIDCEFRHPVSPGGDEDIAVCGLLRLLSRVDDRSLCEVNRDACEACVNDRQPTIRDFNPVIASLLNNLSREVTRRGGVTGCSRGEADRLKMIAQAKLQKMGTARTGNEPRRLHLGATASQLKREELIPLADPSWCHLGDPEDLGKFAEAQSKGGCGRPNVLPFFYRKGTALPFDDDSFSFAYSEHFFEHLFFDEAGELFKECYRVLKPAACLRIVVPDADLRTYQPPESVGWAPSGKQPWTHPDTHKTRWSIYSLRYVLEEIGFRTNGLVYCDKSGKYHCSRPRDSDSFYSKCLDQRFLKETSYILRYENSLVVDAIKPA